MKKTKKMLTVLSLITLFMLLSFSTMAFATSTPASGSGVISDVRTSRTGTGTTDLEGQADVFAQQIVRTARTLGIIALVIMVMICGAKLMFGGEKGITTVKVLVVPILLAAFLVFKTESVVATILNVVGY